MKTPYSDVICVQVWPGTSSITWIDGVVVLKDKSECDVIKTSRWFYCVYSLCSFLTTQVLFPNSLKLWLYDAAEKVRQVNASTNQQPKSKTEPFYCLLPFAVKPQADIVGKFSRQSRLSICFSTQAVMQSGTSPHGWHLHAPSNPDSLKTQIKLSGWSKCTVSTNLSLDVVFLCSPLWWFTIFIKEKYKTLPAAWPQP